MPNSSMIITSRGRIGIFQHKIPCVIGVYPEERLYEQDLIVDLQVEADFSSCALTDQIEDTVDYETLADLCTQLAQERKYQLLETFACEVMQALFERYEIRWAKIQIKKPSALPTAEYAMVELEQKREEHGMDISHRGR